MSASVTRRRVRRGVWMTGCGVKGGKLGGSGGEGSEVEVGAVGPGDGVWLGWGVRVDILVGLMRSGRRNL